MKRTVIALTVLAALTFGGVRNASASLDTTQIIIDENGNGLLSPVNSTLSLSLPGALASDPTGLVAPHTPLTYILPFAVLVGGDLTIQEGANAPSEISDIVRFIPVPGADNNNLGHTVLQFFSDTSDGSDSLADASGVPGGIPPDHYGDILNAAHPGTGNDTTVTELGVEGGIQGYIWTPIAGQVGYADGLSVTYSIISDVPEPTTMIAGAFLLLPFGASTLRVLRKRSAA